MILKNFAFKVKKLIKLLLFRHNSKHSVAYIISFPKAGRTWLSLMIGKAIQLSFRINNVNILNIEELSKQNSKIPRIYLVHDDAPHWKKPHELERTKEFYKNEKVVFLVREPKDVIVSMYFEKKKRLGLYIEKEKAAYQDYFEDERIQPYEDDLQSYLNEEVGSFTTLIEYYNIWAHNRHIVKDFLIVAYEDIHQNPFREVRRVLDFLGLEAVSDKNINEAVAFASFKNMKKMEVKNNFKSHRLLPADPADQESFKTRRGKMRGFVDYLSPDSITFLNKQMDATLTKFLGYSSKD
jgi:hypothetical protein